LKHVTAIPPFAAEGEVRCWPLVIASRAKQLALGI